METGFVSPTLPSVVIMTTTFPFGQGYLANIGSTEENDFILLKLSTHPQ